MKLKAAAMKLRFTREGLGWRRRTSFFWQKLGTQGTDSSMAPTHSWYFFQLPDMIAEGTAKECKREA